MSIGPSEGIDNAGRSYDSALDQWAGEPGLVGFSGEVADFFAPGHEETSEGIVGAYEAAANGDPTGVVVAVVGAGGGVLGGKGKLALKGIEKILDKLPSEVRDAIRREHERQIKKYGSDGVRELENGRFRYNGPVTPPKKEGTMAGRRTVREFDPVTGAKRTWHETIDKNGNVRQVRPVFGEDKNHYMFDENGKLKKQW